MSKGKVIVTEGVLEVLDVFTKELAEGFREAGYDVFELEVKNIYEEYSKMIHFLLTPGKNYVLGMNNWGMNIFYNADANKPKRNIWKQLGIPFIDYIVDTPLYYYDVLTDISSSPDALLCIDQEHVDFVNQYCHEIPMSAFLPHGGKMSGKEKKCIRERSIDVLYAGSLPKVVNPLINIKASYDYPFDFEKMILAIADEMLFNTKLTSITAADAILEREGIVLSEEMRRCLYADAKYCEARAITVYRYNVLKAIAEAGVNLTLCGDGWDTTDILQYPNVKYIGCIKPLEVLELMADTKIVINNMAWFKNGSHERVFNAMLAGAVCASDTTPYLQETFCCYRQEEMDNRHLVVYSIDQPELLGEELRELLRDEACMQAIADRGYEEASQKHTWRMRAKEIASDLFPYL